MHLRQAKVNDALAISELVLAGFIAHIAPDWESSAQRTFLEETGADQLASRISEAAVCLICEEGDQVLGVISLPRPTLVQLFFVAPGHLRKGIGRTLWSAVRTHLEVQHPDVKTVELNSSPYALAAYKALDFFPSRSRSGAKARSPPAWPAGYRATRSSKRHLLRGSKWLVKSFLPRKLPSRLRHTARRSKQRVSSSFPERRRLIRPQARSRAQPFRSKRASA